MLVDVSLVLRDNWGVWSRMSIRAKERFIASTELPGRASVETLYGWAGWPPVQRFKAIHAIDEEFDDAVVSLADRAGLLDSAWRLLPDVAREDPAAATRLKAELQSLVGPKGLSPELIEDWRKCFPPPSTRAAKVKLVASKVEKEANTDKGDDS
jgi:hypothetical protein